MMRKFLRQACANLKDWNRFSFLRKKDRTPSIRIHSPLRNRSISAPMPDFYHLVSPSHAPSMGYSSHQDLPIRNEMENYLDNSASCSNTPSQSRTVVSSRKTSRPKYHQAGSDIVSLDDNAPNRTTFGETRFSQEYYWVKDEWKAAENNDTRFPGPPKSLPHEQSNTTWNMQTSNGNVNQNYSDVIFPTISCPDLFSSSGVERMVFPDNIHSTSQYIMGQFDHTSEPYASRSRECQKDTLLNGNSCKNSVLQATATQSHSSEARQSLVTAAIETLIEQVRNMKVETCREVRKNDRFVKADCKMYT